MLGDADVLPNQVMREVVYLFTNSNTHISSHPLSVLTVEDDDESTTTLSTQKFNIQPRCHRFSHSK